MFVIIYISVCYLFVLLCKQQMEMICAWWNSNKTKCGSILFNVFRGESSHHSHTFSFLCPTNIFIALDLRYKFSETTIYLTYMMTWLDATSVTNGTISDVWGWSHHQGFPKSGFIITAQIFMHINIYFKLWYILYITLYSYYICYHHLQCN